MGYLVTDGEHISFEWGTRLEAIDYANSHIEECIDEGNFEEAKKVRVSRIVTAPVMTGDISRSEANVDEDGWDDGDRFWDEGIDSKPIYEMRCVEPMGGERDSDSERAIVQQLIHDFYAQDKEGNFLEFAESYGNGGAK